MARSRLAKRPAIVGLARAAAIAAGAGRGGPQRPDLDTARPRLRDRLAAALRAAAPSAPVHACLRAPARFGARRAGAGAPRRFGADWRFCFAAAGLPQRRRLGRHGRVASPASVGHPARHPAAANCDHRPQRRPRRPNARPDRGLAALAGPADYRDAADPPCRAGGRDGHRRPLGAGPDGRSVVSRYRHRPCGRRVGQPLGVGDCVPALAAALDHQALGLAAAGAPAAGGVDGAAAAGGHMAVHGSDRRGRSDGAGGVDGQRGAGGRGGVPAAGPVGAVGRVGAGAVDGRSGGGGRSRRTVVAGRRGRPVVEQRRRTGGGPGGGGGAARMARGGRGFCGHRAGLRPAVGPVGVGQRRGEFGRGCLRRGAAAGVHRGGAGVRVRGRGGASRARRRRLDDRSVAGGDRCDGRRFSGRQRRRVASGRARGVRAVRRRGGAARRPVADSCAGDRHGDGGPRGMAAVGAGPADRPVARDLFRRRPRRRGAAAIRQRSRLAGRCRRRSRRRRSRRPDGRIARAAADGHRPDRPHGAEPRPPRSRKWPAGGGARAAGGRAVVERPSRGRRRARRAFQADGGPRQGCGCQCQRPRGQRHLPRAVAGGGGISVRPVGRPQRQLAGDRVGRWPEPHAADWRHRTDGRIPLAGHGPSAAGRRRQGAPPRQPDVEHGAVADRAATARRGGVGAAVGQAGVPARQCGGALPPARRAALANHPRRRHRHLGGWPGARRAGRSMGAVAGPIGTAAVRS